MSEDNERGQRDGLRLAIAILAIEEAKWAARILPKRGWFSSGATLAFALLADAAMELGGWAQRHAS